MGFDSLFGHQFVMTFKEALKKLNIEDYGQRIFSSHSHGELFHLEDYINMANAIKGDASWFRPVFLAVVEFCEEEWERPESCFQWMPRLITDFLNEIERYKNERSGKT